MLLQTRGQSITSQIVSLAVITDNLQASILLIFYNSLKILKENKKHS